MDPTMASIIIFAGNFAPLNWAYCDGSSQSIANNTALFSLLGTTYGGDGQVTFNLPDLRGRVPVGTQGKTSLGEMAGSENVTLLSTNLPSHNHGVTVSVVVSANAPDNSGDPTRLLAASPSKIYATSGSPAAGNLGGHQLSVGVAGSSAPVSIMQPFLAVNYIICVEGVYPSRN